MNHRRTASRLFAILAIALQSAALAQEKLPREMIPAPFDQYITSRVDELSSGNWLEGITPENWPTRRAEMRKELAGMLGMHPMPERTPLMPVVTGTVKGDGFVVENLHFQSSPGVYVTANLYRPETVAKPLPTILYVCGHAGVVEDGVSLGNKTAYQHHGAWFAQNGYVCLILDTIQLGEISGHHHGTYRMGRWWWASRGYTPAGVEAWNGIRALDYLETRPEVDAARIGMTGRSGGGAYTWWVAALDDRIKVAAPTAGITSMHNHVIDGAIEGHCDCMFMVNTSRWDFDRVAALVAPRPLLISNTDSDSIFPLDGVVQVFNRTRSLYRKLGEEANVALHIAEGPHKDTQPVHTAAFHWFHRFLKGGDRMDVLDVRTAKSIPAKTLKVFETLPSDEKVTTVDEFFVPRADWADARELSQKGDDLLGRLRQESFAAWPAGEQQAPTLRTKETFRNPRYVVRASEVTTQQGMNLSLWTVQAASRTDTPTASVLHVLDEESFAKFRHVLEAGATPDPATQTELETLLRDGTGSIAFFSPRGVGSTGWQDLSEQKRTHLARRLQLLGETLESGQVWDVVQVIRLLRNGEGDAAPLTIRANGVMAVNVLYASLFSDGIERLELDEPPHSHRDGPVYLNVLRHMDIPDALLLASKRTHVRITTTTPDQWTPTVKAAATVGSSAKIEVVQTGDTTSR